MLVFVESESGESRACTADELREQRVRSPGKICMPGVGAAAAKMGYNRVVREAAPAEQSRGALRRRRQGEKKMKWGEIKPAIMFSRAFLDAAREAQRLQDGESLGRLREVARNAPPGQQLAKMINTYEDVPVESLRDGDELNSFFGLDGLYVLCSEGLIEAIKVVMEEDCPLKPDFGGRSGGVTPLDFVLETGNQEIARILLDAGAAPSERGLETLAYACLSDEGRKSMEWAVKMLGERGFLERAPKSLLKALAQMEEEGLSECVSVQGAVSGPKMKL